MKRSRCLFIAAGVGALAFAHSAAAQESEYKHEVEVGPGGGVQTETEVQGEAPATTPGQTTTTTTTTQTETGQAAPPATVPPETTTAPPPVYVEPETNVNIEPAPRTTVVAERRRPFLVTPFGTEVTLGGGVRDFTEDRMRDQTTIGGAWDARLLFGSRSLLGVEAAYVGSANNIHALGLDPNAALMSHGVEGALRVNFLTGMWQPYILGGAGWQHYSLVNEDFNTSDVSGSDDLVSFPLGAGLAFRYQGFVADVRGVYRPTADADLFAGDDGNMPTVQGDLTAGVEF